MTPAHIQQLEFSYYTQSTMIKVANHGIVEISTAVGTRASPKLLGASRYFAAKFCWFLRLKNRYFAWFCSTGVHGDA